MCQNRDRSYRNAGRTLRVHAPSMIRRAEGEKGLAARAAHPLKISNLFHFKVPAPIGIRAKKSRRTYTITYRMENGTYMGWTSRVTLLPTPIAYDTCVLATSGTTHPLPSLRTYPRASLRDTDVHVRGVAKAAAPCDS